MLITAKAFSLLTCISYIVIETLNGVIQCFQFNMGQSMLFGCATGKPHTQNEVRKMESGLKKKKKERKNWLLVFLKRNLFIPWGVPGGTSGKSPPANAAAARDVGSTPGWGRSLGGGNPLRYSGWGNPMDKGAWRATVHGAAKSQT